jgi:hypothetical protein
LLGSAEDPRIDPERVQRRPSREDYGAVRASLRSIGCRFALALLATYAGQAKDLAPRLQKAQINLDATCALITSQLVHEIEGRTP